MPKHSPTPVLLTLTWAILTAACATEAQPTPAALPTDPAVAFPLDNPAPAVTPDALTGADGHPTPTPRLPEGWTEQTNAELDVTFALPPGWEVAPEESHTIGLRETGGDGWAQVSVLDEETSTRWGIAYREGMPAAWVLDALLGALREDGDFTAPAPVETREGYEALASEGVYHVMGERLLVAVVGLPDRTIVVLGHGGETPDDPDAEWSRLRPLYERLVWSITQP